MNPTVNYDEKKRQCKLMLRHAAAGVDSARKEVWAPVKVACLATALTAVSGWGAIKVIWWANTAIQDKNLFYDFTAAAIFGTGVIGGIAALSWSELFNRRAKGDRLLLRYEKRKLAAAKEMARESGIDIKRSLRAG